jgi:uncharacterized cupredoxin-like copper-binding protein
VSTLAELSKPLGPTSALRRADRVSREDPYPLPSACSHTTTRLGRARRRATTHITCARISINRVDRDDMRQTAPHEESAPSAHNTARLRSHPTMILKLLFYAAVALLARPHVFAADTSGQFRDGQGHNRAVMSQAPDAPFGREGDARKVRRIIRIDMSDTMRYFPDQIRVKRGDTIRFIARNSGKVPHEMVLGTMEGLKKHAAAMRQSGSTDHDHVGAIHLAPGATGRLVWQFTKTGEYYYGCLVPGHFEAGMIGTVVVVR